MATPATPATAFLASPGIEPATLVALASALPSRETPSELTLPIDLPAKEAAQLFRLGARWAAAVVAKISDPATLHALLGSRRETRKTVVAAAASNPHLPAGVARRLLDVALSEALDDVVYALVNQADLSLTDALAVFSVNGPDPRTPWLPASRFAPGDLEAAVAHESRVVAASAVRATCVVGSPTDSRQCRRLVMKHLVRRDDGLTVAALALNPGYGKFRPSEQAALGRDMVELDTQFWVRALRTATTTSYTTWTDTAAALMWDAVRDTDEGDEATVLTLILEAVPVALDVLEELADHPSVEVRGEVISRLNSSFRQAILDKDPDEELLARVDALLEKVARGWDLPNGGAIQTIFYLQRPLSDEALLNALRNGNVTHTKQWLIGRYPPHRPTAALVAALVADPGTAFWELSSTSREPEVVPASAGALQYRGGGARPTDASAAALAEAVTALPGVLRCTGDVIFGPAGLAALTLELTRRAASNPQAWALATELFPTWDGTIVELVSVALSASQ